MSVSPKFSLRDPDDSGSDSQEIYSVVTFDVDEMAWYSSKADDEDSERDLHFAPTQEESSRAAEDSRRPQDVEANCPVCRVGHVSRKFTTVGILMAIFLFPCCGVLCCYLSSVRKCDSCGYEEGF